MKHLHDFLVMGGYAVYVWPAYGLAVAVLIGNFIYALRNKRKMLQKIKRQLSMEKSNSCIRNVSNG